MRTQTIFEAYGQLEFENGQTWQAFAEDLPKRKARQLKKFRDEIERRLSERDGWHTMFPISEPHEVARLLMPRLKVTP